MKQAAQRTLISNSEEAIRNLVDNIDNMTGAFFISGTIESGVSLGDDLAGRIRYLGELLSTLSVSGESMLDGMRGNQQYNQISAQAKTIAANTVNHFENLISTL